MVGEIIPECRATSVEIRIFADQVCRHRRRRGPGSPVRHGIVCVGDLAFGRGEDRQSRAAAAHQHSRRRIARICQTSRVSASSR